MEPLKTNQVNGLNAIQYGVKKEDGLIDYAEVEALALSTQTQNDCLTEHRPIRVGIDFAKFREIADKSRSNSVCRYCPLCWFGGWWLYPSPFRMLMWRPTTTHKTLRYRGGMIMTNDEAIAKKANSAIFPWYSRWAVGACDRRKSGGLP